MPALDDDQDFMPSILDRLIDLEPWAESEEPQSRRQMLIAVKESLRRDLANLLNTRWSCTAWPPDLSELGSSIVNYGIPDFTGVNMASPENQEQLLKIVEHAIKVFEPRLIRFSVGKDQPGLDRKLHFKIEGVLRAEPYPEEVFFDASLKTQSSEFELSHT